MKILCKLTLLAALAVLWSVILAAQQSAYEHSSELRAHSSSWPQYGFVAGHSSFNNTEHFITRTNLSGLTLTWAGEVGASTTLAPVVGHNVVYAAAGGMIFAFHASDGTLLWSHLSCSGVGTMQPALGPHAVLVGDAGGDLAAYDPITGDQIWCGDEGGSITSAPAVDENTVYVTNGNSVVAVDQLTGRGRWRFSPSDLTPLTSAPAVFKHAVYVTGGSSVFALDRTSGEQLWRTDLEPQVNISAPSVAGNIVYVGGTTLHALRASNGHLLWATAMVGANVGTPAIAYGKVFVNRSDPQFGLWAFRADTGAFLWRNPSAGESEATVTVANGVLFDLAESGELKMFNSQTGAFLGSVVDPSGHPFNYLFGSQPAVVNRTVYIPTADPRGSNRVDAFRLPSHKDHNE